MKKEIVIRLEEEKLEKIRERYGSLENAIEDLLEEGKEEWNPSIPQKYQPAWKALDEEAQTKFNREIPLSKAISIVSTACDREIETARHYLRKLDRNYHVIEVPSTGRIRVKTKEEIENAAA
jgi:hypothetical protein